VIRYDHYAEEIKIAGERAASLTKQLLAFSRKQVIEPKVLDLNAIIRESTVMLQRLIGDDIVLETHLDDLPWGKSWQTRIRFIRSS
jgi:two-component system, cell cycle sensor histidine kinase and response regulator CckA